MLHFRHPTLFFGYGCRICSIGSLQTERAQHFRHLAAPPLAWMSNLQQRFGSDGTDAAFSTFAARFPVRMSILQHSFAHDGTVIASRHPSSFSGRGCRICSNGLPQEERTLHFRHLHPQPQADALLQIANILYKRKTNRYDGLNVPRTGLRTQKKHQTPDETLKNGPAGS